jgi:hypothetical protein
MLDKIQFITGIVHDVIKIYKKYKKDIDKLNKK